MVLETIGNTRYTIVRIGKRIIPFFIFRQRFRSRLDMTKHDVKNSEKNSKSKSQFLKIRILFSKIAVLVALIAIFYRNKDEIRDWFDSTPKEIIEEEKRKESVLQALLSIERNWVRKTERPTGSSQICFSL